MSRNVKYVLNSGVEFTAPKDVVDYIYDNNMFITTGCNRQSITVHKYNKHGEAVYVGTLASFVKPRKAGNFYRYRDKDTHNITKRNLI